MNNSSLHTSLLMELRAGRAGAWQRLTRLYAPTVYGWCRRANLSASDAADISQEVFLAVAGNLEKFRRDRAGDSFAGWLAVITRNKINDFFRRQAKSPQGVGGSTMQQRLAELPQDDSELGFSRDGLSSTSSENRSVLFRAAELVRAEFEPNSWQAFWRTAVDGLPASDVAAELGISANAVYKAKSRVLQRLRSELAGLL